MRLVKTHASMGIGVLCNSNASSRVIRTDDYEHKVTCRNCRRHLQKGIQLSLAA